MKNSLSQQYQKEGRYVSVNQTKAFVYEKGKGEAVVCFHGVPASSFLYRKVIDQLAKNGFRGISFDIIGTGLSDRPTNFDYSWTSLGQWCTDLIITLELDKFHVVLHDIGGPIAAEVMAKLPNKVSSVTLLNTMLGDLSHFKKPFPMNLYSIKGLGELIVNTTTPSVFKQLMYASGVQDKKEFTIDDAKAYVAFLKGNDNGKSFLKIMRNFEANAHKETLYLNSINNLNVPKQIIWGENDKALSLERYGIPLQKQLGLDTIHHLKGKHFLQEDCAVAIANRIATMVTTGKTSIS